MKHIKKLLGSLLLVLFLFIVMSPRNESQAASIKSPKLLSTKANNANSIKIKWKKVSGANGYVIYLKKGNGSYKKIEDISNGKKTSFVIKYLQPATKYSFKLKAYKGRKFSSSSSSKTVYTLPKTPKKLKAVAVSDTQIKLTWGQVSKASGYEIYQNFNGNLKKVGNNDLGGKTSYNVNNLQPATTYDFVVRAYLLKAGKKIYSAKSVVVSAKTKVHKHTLQNYKCTTCGKITNAYGYLYAWVIENGIVNGEFIEVRDGDYCLSYDAKYDYIYISSGYYNRYDDFVFASIHLDDFEFFGCIGDNVYDDYVKGRLDGKRFTSNSPLIYDYYNNTYYGYGIVEDIRWEICDNLDWFEQFLLDNDLGITLYDLGFLAY